MLPVICGDELAEPARCAALAAGPDIWTYKVTRSIDNEKKWMIMFLMVKVMEYKSICVIRLGGSTVVFAGAS